MNTKDFFSKSLQDSDKEVFQSIEKELKRQQNTIELIASENIVSKAVLQAQGNIFTNKYAEGYPNKRYYGGCDYADEVEIIAQDRLKKLFDCKYANVQPHSGSQANMAVYLGLMEVGDTLMGMDLNAGGHLTHGAKVSFSGRLYKVCSYGVDKQTNEIDYQAIEEVALKSLPKIIIAGGSAYSKLIDFKRFREIADKVGAYLMVDMAHFAGLVAAKEIPSPVPFADVITSTTHKTLRGPRGGIILSNNEDIMKKINSAVFPRMQGGPLVHTIAAKALSFKEALSDDYKIYIKQVIKNAKAMAKFFIEKNVNVIANGTDTHLFLLDVSSFGVNGDVAEKYLDKANITCNKNSIPFDTLPPSKTSGIRIGTPAITTRGFQEEDVLKVAEIIYDILSNINGSGLEIESDTFKKAKKEVASLCSKYPIYNN